MEHLTSNAQHPTSNRGDATAPAAGRGERPFGKLRVWRQTPKLVGRVVALLIFGCGGVGAEEFVFKMHGDEGLRLDVPGFVSQVPQSWVDGAGRSIQRPVNEVLKPPKRIASMLAQIGGEMRRREVEAVLAKDGWEEMSGSIWNSGYHADYMSRNHQGYVVKVSYGWTERGVRNGRLWRHAGPTAAMLAPPAVVKTKFQLPNESWQAFRRYISDLVK